MPLGNYLERRDVQLIAVVGFLIGLLLMHQYGAFIAYGIPGITFHEVTQTNPVSKSVVILGSYGDWISYEYYNQIRVEWKNALGVVRYSTVGLTVKTQIKVEVTDLALSGFLTEIKPPPFLINESETEILYKNMTVQAYAYGFKVTTSWSGTAQVSVIEDGQTSPLMIGGPSYEELHKEAVKRLVPDFNKNYITSAKILMSIDAPTLASDKAYELRPDYLGIAGMWLADYEMVGYTTGTATEMLPKSTGTAVKLYRDKALTSPCWAPDYDTTLGKPLLTPSVVYWLDHFTPASAWWKISIVNLGSQLVYDDTRADPNYLCWAWEKYPVDQDGDGKTDVPAVAQWFRVDLVFRTTKDWIVPKIPEYELPPDVKEKMKIIIVTEPQNQGTPLDQPPVAPTIPWREIMYIMLIFFGGLIAVIIVYYVSKGKLGAKKT
jgi:hypothetical protein